MCSQANRFAIRGSCACFRRAIIVQVHKVFPNDRLLRGNNIVNPQLLLHLLIIINLLNNTYR